MQEQRAHFTNHSIPLMASETTPVIRVNVACWVDCVCRFHTDVAITIKWSEFSVCLPVERGIVSTLINHVVSAYIHSMNVVDKDNNASWGILLVIGLDAIYICGRAKC